MSDKFTPRFLSASEYVLELHRPGQRVAVLARNRSRQHAVQRILNAETVADLPFQTWLKEQNDAGADIFIGMNPLKDKSHSRTKESIEEIRHVYLDLDEEAGASLEAIRTSGDIPVPNFVLDTSPGKHQVIWRVEGLDQPMAESLLRALAAHYGGDPAATDASRLLRLPGFANRKYNERFVVGVHYELDHVYHSRDFQIHEGSPDSSRHLPSSRRSGRKLPVGHRSQSETDWAFAKRALARGDKAEDIIRRIADYRADDKADPFYYARHTVIKAQLCRARHEPAETSVAQHENTPLPDNDGYRPRI
jgi:DNA primase RepB-like protein